MIMGSDPMFNDTELAKAVIGDMQQNIGRINNALPADVNAQLLISQAKARVLSTRNVKGNAFNGRKATNTPKGGVGGPTSKATSEEDKAKEKRAADIASISKSFGKEHPSLASWLGSDV